MRRNPNLADMIGRLSAADTSAALHSTAAEVRTALGGPLVNPFLPEPECRNAAAASHLLDASLPPLVAPLLPRPPVAPLAADGGVDYYGGNSGEWPSWPRLRSLNYDENHFAGIPTKGTRKESYMPFLQGVYFRLLERCPQPPTPRYRSTEEPRFYKKVRDALTIEEIFRHHESVTVV